MTSRSDQVPMLPVAHFDPREAASTWPLSSPTVTDVTDVLVVVGMGGMGEAIARRVGVGHQVLLADVDEGTLDASAAALRANGLDVATQQVDVADPASVAELTEAAAARGPVRSLAHTAGLSPVQVPSDRIVDVDLLGVAHALEAFAFAPRHEQPLPLRVGS